MDIMETNLKQEKPEKKDNVVLAETAQDNDKGKEKEQKGTIESTNQQSSGVQAQAVQMAERMVHIAREYRPDETVTKWKQRYKTWKEKRRVRQCNIYQNEYKEFCELKNEIHQMSAEERQYLKCFYKKQMEEGKSWGSSHMLPIGLSVLALLLAVLPVHPPDSVISVVYMAVIALLLVYGYLIHKSIRKRKKAVYVLSVIEEVERDEQKTL